MDAILEFMALGLICLLRMDIYESENALLDGAEDGATSTGIREDFFQADVQWFLAFLSILFSFCYVIYLYRKLSKDLDVCDFYHQKD